VGAEIAGATEEGERQTGKARTGGDQNAIVLICVDIKGWKEGRSDSNSRRSKLG
jgi:hypothetical protein